MGWLRVKDCERERAGSGMPELLKSAFRKLPSPLTTPPARLCLIATILVVSAMTALSQTSTPSTHFTDVTKAAGLTFTHYSGAFGKKYLPETLGPGVAFIDYNNDGWQDLFFTNGKDWPGRAGRGATLQLFRNNKNGAFTDVSRAAGLAREAYAMGAAVGDFDNDGDEDLFVTAL